MRNKFDRQLEQLNNLMIEMGNLIEEAINMSTKALVTRDVELAKEAIAFEKDVDLKEKEIEAYCLNLLMQQQPVARDLRLISSALKMITDMERIGDHASDISEMAIFMSDSYQVDSEPEFITDMAEAATKMVRDSVDAFVKTDLDEALDVIAYDDVIDGMFRDAKGKLIEIIRVNADNGERAMDLLMVAKYFERIGDHAENIAEWVVFSITGSHVGE